MGKRSRVLNGAHLFAIFEKLFEADGNSIATVKYDVFETWHKLQILQCELRMYDAGLSEAYIRAWQDSCTSEMQRRLGNLREQMARIQ